MARFARHSGDEWKAISPRTTYDDNIQQQITSGIVVQDIRRDLEPSLGGPDINSNKPRILYINVNDWTSPNQPFKSIGNYFHIWHEIERTHYSGVHMFWFNGYKVVLVNIAESARFKGLKGGSDKVFVPHDFPPNS